MSITQNDMRRIGIALMGLLSGGLSALLLA
jgi:hypothetical protein